MAFIYYNGHYMSSKLTLFAEHIGSKVTDVIIVKAKTDGLSPAKIQGKIWDYFSSATTRSPMDKRLKMTMPYFQNDI